MTVRDFQRIRDLEWDFTSGEQLQTHDRLEPDEAAEITPAVRDAFPLPGPHPVVIYVGAAWASDPLTPAYLASRGYVVAAFTNNGRMTHTSLEYSPNALTLDTGIDDLGFVYSLLQREPIVDTDRLALYTFSATSLDALLWQMRDMQADALVFVEGWERFRSGATLVRESVHYDPLRVRVPILLVEGETQTTRPDFALVGDVLDSLSYASVTRVTFPRGEHGDFLSNAPLPRSENGDRVYTDGLEIIERFLDTHLQVEPGPGGGIEPPADASDAFFTVRQKAGSPAAPSEEELFRLAEEDPEVLAELVGTIGKRTPGRPLFREHVLARAALFAPDPTDRVTIWRLVVEAYPRSTSARFQLGTSLAEIGEAQEAREVLEAARGGVADDPAIPSSNQQGWLERIEEALRGLDTAE